MKTKTISYAANEWGYVVQVYDGGQPVEVYHAGNHNRDSQLTVVPGSINADSATTVMRYAFTTAMEMAREWKVAKKNVCYDSDLHDEINEIDGGVVIGVIHLPRCWKRLVSTVFKGSPLMGYYVTLNGKKQVVKSESYQRGNDDPMPYYDDGRNIERGLPDGKVLSLDLTSGQSNYYAGALLYDNGEPIYESDPITSFDDML